MHHEQAHFWYVLLNLTTILILCCSVTWFPLQHQHTTTHLVPAHRRQSELNISTTPGQIAEKFAVKKLKITL